MRNRKIVLSALVSCTLLTIPSVEAELTAEERLLQQIQVGEYTNKSDIVEQALYRLESISPNDPNVLAAKIRRSLRMHDESQALADLEQLKKLAPDSAAYQQAKTMIYLYGPDGQQQLQEARLSARSGHLEQAKAAYDSLFKGDPPTIDLAVEYWRLVAQLPKQKTNAIKQLQKIDRANPGSPVLREALVNMLFEEGQVAQGFALLQSMAASPETKDMAADLWLNQIKNLPVTNDSVKQLQQFTALYNGNEQAGIAQQLLDQQQKNLADPGFVARQKGLALAQSSNKGAAIGALQQAIKTNPNDAEVAGALGASYASAGNRSRAIAMFEKAYQLDKNDKWRSLINDNRYWLLIKLGDDALNKGDYLTAEKHYQQANRLDSRDPEALLGLGDVAVAKQNDAGAERYYQQVMKIDRQNSRAMAKLADIYLRQSPEKALNYLDNLEQQQRTGRRASNKSYLSDILQKQADVLEKQQKYQQAADKQLQARQLTPDDVWLTYGLARNLQKSGQTAQGDEFFNRLAPRHVNDPEFVYAYSLYLSLSDRGEAAEQRINQLPRNKWSSNLTELAQQLALDNTLAKATKMREQGDENGAIHYLQQQSANNQIDALLAEWAVARQDYANAHLYYQQILQRTPNNEEAILADAETYLAQGDKQTTRQKLVYFDQHPASSLGMQRRIANAWLESDEPERANNLFQTLRQQVEPQGPIVSQDNALLWRDIARSERDNNKPQQALDDYRQAMLASGIAPHYPKDNNEFTALTRSNGQDDWLQRSIRADAGQLYQQQNTTITLDHDYWGSSGTKGISDLKAQTTMLEIATPVNDGRAFFRTDYVMMNAGTFTPNNYFEKFGTCNSIGCDRDHQQKAQGASVAVGWKNDIWNMDIGTTPMGFEVVDWVGGISYKTDWNNIGWTFTASRRPISSSLLSFAGSKDPYTGTSWGGVRATGGAISLSYDRGEANGIWADLSAHQLSGKNVENNQRERLMAGYYHRLINEENREVTVGLTSMLWHYQKDLSSYSLGQGGYYSPQRYFSLALPVNYRQRTDNWSWELAGSVSWSNSSTSQQRRYPIRGLIPSDLPDIDAIESDGGGTGVGYTARALIERRLTSHWSIGAGVDIQQAKDYSPSHALLYLRYSFADWLGNMDMPPQPLTPYADFK